MAIRKAVQEDLDAVKAIYKKIFQYQNEGKLLVGWVEGVYPTDETAEKAFKNGDLFVMEEDGKILASARINQDQEEEYRAADWKYKGVPDQEVYVGIRPEGFLWQEDGPLHCEMGRVEVMGRDISIVSSSLR